MLLLRAVLVPTMLLPAQVLIFFEALGYMIASEDRVDKVFSFGVGVRIRAHLGFVLRRSCAITPFGECVCACSNVPCWKR